MSILHNSFDIVVRFEALVALAVSKTQGQDQDRGAVCKGLYWLTQRHKNKVAHWIFVF